MGQTHFEATVPVMYSLGCMLACRENPGEPVTPAYQPPFHFTGTLHHVTIDVSGELLRDKKGGNGLDDGAAVILDFK